MTCVGDNAVSGVEAKSWANGIFYGQRMDAWNDWTAV